MRQVSFKIHWRGTPVADVTSVADVWCDCSTRFGKTPMTDYLKIRSNLEAQLARLLERAEEIEERLSDPNETDSEERAKEIEDDEVLASVGDLTKKEIVQIRQAINQIDHGNYGTCLRCGNRIAPERLEVLPFATTCAGCG